MAGRPPGRPSVSVHLPVGLMLLAAVLLGGLPRPTTAWFGELGAWLDPSQAPAQIHGGSDAVPGPMALRLPAEIERGTWEHRQTPVGGALASGAWEALWACASSQAEVAEVRPADAVEAAGSTGPRGPPVGLLRRSV